MTSPAVSTEPTFDELVDWLTRACERRLKREAEQAVGERQAATPDPGGLDAGDA